MKRTLLENISINLLMKILSGAFAMITVMHATRALRPGAYGRVSFASTIAGYFLVLSNLGLQNYATRTCAAHSDDRRGLSRAFNELWSIKVVLSLASGGAFALLILLVPGFRKDAPLFLAFGSGMALQAMGCEWLFRGLEQFRFLAVSGACFRLVALLGMLAFVRSEAHALRFAVLSALASYGGNLACFAAQRRFVDVSFRLRLRKTHIRPLLVFFLMSCAVYVYSSLDLTMLGLMKSDYETGLYSIASKGKAFLTTVSGVVMSSMLPRAAEYWQHGEKARFEAMVSKLMLAVFVVQSTVAVVCLCFAGPIIRLIGGTEYLEAVGAFRILVLSILPIGLSNILGGGALLAAGKERRLLAAEITGAVVNFAANLVLIPLYSMKGAAATTVVAEIVVWLMCLRSVRRDLGMGPGAKRLFR